MVENENCYRGSSAFGFALAEILRTGQQAWLDALLGYPSGQSQKFIYVLSRIILGLILISVMIWLLTGRPQIGCRPILLLEYG